MRGPLTEFAWRALALAGRVALVARLAALALDWYLHPPVRRRWP